jgi:hypothetical protein
MTATLGRVIALGLKAGQVLGEARNSAEMIDIWRATKEKIGLSNCHCDELANFIGGHCDKILGPSGSKNFGPLSFTALNWTFAIKWVAVVDAEQLAIMEQYWEDRQRDASNVRTEPNRVSKKIIERAKPIILKEFGEKLTLALGDDIGHLLLGMKLPDRADQAALDHKPNQAVKVENVEPTKVAIPQCEAPPAESRAHLRVVQTKGRSKHG